MAFFGRTLKASSGTFGRRCFRKFLEEPFFRKSSGTPSSGKFSEELLLSESFQKKSSSE